MPLNQRAPGQALPSTPWSWRCCALARKYAARFWMLPPGPTRSLGGRGQARVLRAAVELDADTVAASIHGRCAYDTVSRAAFLSKLVEVAPAVVPFARSFYALSSTYLLWGTTQGHATRYQGEGGEQGDALAPALLALAVHDALPAAQAELAEGD